MQQTEFLARVGGWELDYLTGSLYWTDETYRIHETSPEQYTPTVETALAFYAPGSRELVSEAVRRGAVDGTPWDLELEVLTARGRRIDVRATGVVEMDGSRAIRAYGAFQDITQHKRLEHQLLAAGKMESIGRMAGGIAHDFNNWITAILSYAEKGLRTATEGSSEHQAIQRIRQAAEHATSLTRQLISLARPKAATTAIVDINDLLQTMLPLLSGLVDPSIQIRTRLAPGLLHVRINASQFRQVLLNLIMNARDAMPAGGVVQIQTELHRIDAAATAELPASSPETSMFVGVSVSDTGEGMTRETLEHLFEPFFTTKPGGKGTGLGLATCYSIVKASGGNIQVQSTPGQGSRFTIFLPSLAVPGYPPPVPGPTLTPHIEVGKVHPPRPR